MPMCLYVQTKINFVMGSRMHSNAAREELYICMFLNRYIISTAKMAYGEVF